MPNAYLSWVEVDHVGREPFTVRNSSLDLHHPGETYNLHLRPANVARCEAKCISYEATKLQNEFLYGHVSYFFNALRVGALLSS